MRRVIAPALLAIFCFAGTSADAGFGLFDRAAGHGCDSACFVEPTCGFESAAPCCDESPCRGGLLHKLFHRGDACDAGCGVADCGIEPACGFENAPVDCGCTLAAPTCGCEVAAPCCGSDRKLGGFFHKLFHHNRDCGCDVEPVCGCEPVYGL